jgi:hypothetical protein
VRAELKNQDMTIGRDLITSLQTDVTGSNLSIKWDQARGHLVHGPVDLGFVHFAVVLQWHFELAHFPKKRQSKQQCPARSSCSRVIRGLGTLATGNSGTEPLHLPCFLAWHRPWSVQSAPTTSLIHAQSLHLPATRTNVMSCANN